MRSRETFLAFTRRAIPGLSREGMHLDIDRYTRIRYLSFIPVPPSPVTA